MLPPPRARIFLSYKRDHAATSPWLQPIIDHLDGAGFEVFHDDRTPGGQRWSDELYHQLLACDAAVVLASEAARSSDWCTREQAILAFRESTQGLRVVPLIVDELDWKELGALAHLQATGARTSEHSEAEVLQRLTLAFAGVHPAAVSADARLARHHLWLRTQFHHAPVFGQEAFSLADTFVESKCRVDDWGDLRPRRSPHFQVQSPVRDLEEAVLDLLSDGRRREPIVVEGPAGAGKSTACLHLAQRLLDAGLHPFLVRFRDLRLSVFPDDTLALLEDALRYGPISDAPPEGADPVLSPARFRESCPPPGRRDHIRRLVFILDGWDEVSLASSAGYQEQLGGLLPRLREALVDLPGPPVRLIVTGRPSQEVTDSSFLHTRTPVLTILPMEPSRLRVFGHKLVAAADWGLTQAQVDSVVQRYTASLDKPGTPVDFVGLPLLAHLAFRTIGGRDVDELLSSPTSLYKALVDQTVAHAGKALDAEVEGSVHQGGRELRALLQRTASAVSVTHSERMSHAELERRLKGEEALHAWVDRTTGDRPLHALLVNYYFKGGLTDFGCEFLHKSFREYLHAEDIVALLTGLADEHGPWALPPPNLDYWEDFDERHHPIQHAASRGLATRLCGRWLSLEVRAHVFALIESDQAEHPERWTVVRELLADVWAWWAEGVHLRPQPGPDGGWADPYVSTLLRWSNPEAPTRGEAPQRTAGLDAHIGWALLNITAFVHWTCMDPELRMVPMPQPGRNTVQGRRRTWYQAVDRDMVRFCPGSGGPGGDGRISYLRNLAGRIEAGGLRPDGVGLGGVFLAGVDERAADLRGLQLEHAELCGAVLQRTDLSRANLNGASLTAVSATGLFADHASAQECDLSSADLSSSTWSGARLRGTTVFASNLSYARMYGCDLGGAQLDQADLQGADLSTARLSGASLSTATLHRGILTGARYRPEDHRDSKGQLLASATTFPPDFDPSAAGMIPID